MEFPKSRRLMKNVFLKQKSFKKYPIIFIKNPNIMNYKSREIIFKQ